MTSWAEFYRSDLQSVFGLLIIPFAFLVYRAIAPRPREAVAPESARFVDLYTLIFALETMLDPIATGPMLRALGWSEASAGTAVSFLFVYLGDFRVLALIFGVALARHGLARPLAIAALCSLIVPITAGSLYAALKALLCDLPGQVLWLLYEAGFLMLVACLSRLWLTKRADSLPSKTVSFLRDVAAFAGVYYALWASADLLILWGGLDAGWAIRIIPNQLYYAIWIPFVYFRFFGPYARA